MKPVVEAVVEAGLVPEEALDELARWGVHIKAVPNERILHSPEAVVNHLREALESEEQVRIDQTDLDLLTRYLDKNNQKRGRLILKEGKQHTTVNVSFCLTQLEEYAIPWTDPDEPDILVNGESHLKWTDDDGTEYDVRFIDVRELFFGSKKAFAVCIPLLETSDE
jgi:hypothetical protein